MQPKINLLKTNVIDVTNGNIIRNVDIHIEEGRFTNITPSYGYKILEEGNCIDIDASELWAIPGLIDCHVHLTLDHNQDTAKIFKYDEEFSRSLERAEQNIHDALSVGITTMRDAGAFSGRNNSIRDIIEQDIGKYKFRLVSCGRHITIENAHMSSIGVVWDKIISLGELVKDEISRGADFIKVMNDDIIFDIEQLSEITNTAHQQGTKVACHAFTPKSIEIALSANVDTIEHGYPFTEEAARKMAKQNVFLCPTFVASYDTAFRMNEQTVQDMFPDCTMDEFLYWYEQLKRFVPLAFRNNVKIITGTDAGTPPTDFKSLIREISFLVELGATNLQALQSCTINGAMALGIENIVGSIEVGKGADIILLKNNPLENITTALANIQVVISRGYLACQYER